MTDLARFARRLAQVLRSNDPASVYRPVTVSDLRRFVMPYRLHRNALGLTSAEEYELLVLRLTAEEHGFVRTFPVDVADRCRAELETPNPDLGLVEAIGDATVQLGASSLARLASSDDAEPRAAAERSGQSEAAVPADELADTGTSAPPAEAEAAAQAAPRRKTGATSRGGAFVESGPALPQPDARGPTPAAAAAVDGADTTSRCRFCATMLPLTRRVVYCPFCGHQLLPVSCPRCGTEIEPGWRYCITCGHQAGVASTSV